MSEETSGIYGKPKFGLIVAGAGVALILLLIAALLYLRTGHPVFHTEPQPRNNKGLIVPLPVGPMRRAA
ncbi:hypothetical protein [Terriglobus sp.]|uniref:hypothetical protein n=1 Tax=Terriglobus sp. TaxID=1889013 RepID=UPI003AFF84F8